MMEPSLRSISSSVRAARSFSRTTSAMVSCSRAQMASSSSEELKPNGTSHAPSGGALRSTAASSTTAPPPTE